MCLWPQLITNPKYKKNQKNGGNIPPISDIRTIKVPIGCGNCIECRKQKAMQWKARLMEDIKEHKNGQFITLTFSNDSIKEIDDQITKNTKPPFKAPEAYERDNAIATYAVRHFLERWRKKTKKSVRHWLITELGHRGTENIHIHGIIWTDIPQLISQTWQYGYVWDGYKKNGRRINYVNETTISYITKYVTKLDVQHKYYKSIILTSAGIGRNYTTTGEYKNNKYKEGQTDETYRTRQRAKINLPIYWRNKLYTDEEKEKLWIEKLNKEERWICGKKIDISKNENEYYRVLEEERRRNNHLGYGNGKPNWKRKEYEHQRRIIIQETRIHMANTKRLAGEAVKQKG